MSLDEVFRRLDEAEAGERRTPAIVNGVEAIQFTGNFAAVERFVGGDSEWRGGHLVVATRQGALKAYRDDWIVKNPDGTFRACSPAEYAALSAEQSGGTT